MRTFLTLLYLLLMVALPWLHLPLHGQETEQEIHAHSCSHHDHGNHEPEEEEECGLCNLVVLPADIPPDMNPPQFFFQLQDIPLFTACLSGVPTEPPHQARAPPNMTV